MTTPLYLILLGILVMTAVRFGSAPERILAWTLLAADLFDHLNHRVFGPTDFKSVDPGHFVIDSLAMLVLLWVGLRANRFWPLPVCSLQLITFTGHLAVLSAIPGFNQAYWAMNTIPQLIQWGIVLGGIFYHARRQARIGPYSDWRLGLTTFSGKLVFLPQRTRVA
jgi:hypothetical protein